MAELCFFDKCGTTFGCPVASPTALKRMKQRAEIKSYKLPQEIYPHKRRVVKAVDVAAVMGGCAWLVLERQDFYKVEIVDKDETFYIEYEQENGGGAQ